MDVYGNNYLFGIHNIDQGFRDGHLADGAHVETVHIIPPVDLLILVLPVFNAADEQGASERKTCTLILVVNIFSSSCVNADNCDSPPTPPALMNNISTPLAVRKVADRHSEFLLLLDHIIIK